MTAAVFTDNWITNGLKIRWTLTIIEQRFAVTNKSYTKLHYYSYRWCKNSLKHKTDETLQTDDQSQKYYVHMHLILAYIFTLRFHANICSIY